MQGTISQGQGKGYPNQGAINPSERAEAKINRLLRYSTQNRRARATARQNDRIE